MMSSAEKKKKFSRRMSEVINAHPTPNADPGSFLYNAIAIDFTTFKWIGNQYHYRPCNTGFLRLKCKTIAAPNSSPNFQVQSSTQTPSE